MFGVIVVNKPQGMTSHDVVNAMRRRFQTRRVGHSGTLDPMATGVLVLAIGPATRFLQYLPLEPKVYEGEITFGATTNTQDAEGEVDSMGEVPADLRSRIDEELPQFLGQIDQIPPMYSAIKHQGRPLYQLARAGVEVDRKTRTVFIDSFEVPEIHGSKATFRVVCSGGTYVRTLAHDLGQAIGCGAHLSRLHRSAVGPLSDELAVEIEEASVEHLIPLREALLPMLLVPLEADQIARARVGNVVRLPLFVDRSHVALLDETGEVFCIARTLDDLHAQPECVIPLEAMNGLV